jgi:hypothetical protein
MKAKTAKKSQKTPVKPTKTESIWDKDLKATGMVIFLALSFAIIGLVIYALQVTNFG